jgi:hypothetical protein
MKLFPFCDTLPTAGWLESLILCGNKKKLPLTS